MSTDNEREPDAGASPDEYITDGQTGQSHHHADPTGGSARTAAASCNGVSSVTPWAPPGRRRPSR